MNLSFECKNNNGKKCIDHNNRYFNTISFHKIKSIHKGDSKNNNKSNSSLYKSSINTNKKEKYCSYNFMFCIIEFFFFIEPPCRIVKYKNKNNEHNTRKYILKMTSLNSKYKFCSENSPKSCSGSKNNTICRKKYSFFLKSYDS